MVNNDHPVMRHPSLTNKYKEIVDKNKWPTAWNIRFGAIHEAIDGVVKNMSAFHGAFQRVMCIHPIRMLSTSCYLVSVDVIVDVDDCLIVFYRQKHNIK